MSKLMKLIDDYVDKVNSTPDGEVVCEGQLTEAVRSLTEPTASREGMSELYDSLLGYDPTTHFDNLDIATVVSSFQKDHEDLFDAITADVIIDAATDIYKRDRRFNQAQAIKSAMIACEDVSTAAVDEFESIFITPFIAEDEDDSSISLDDIEDDTDTFDDDLEIDEDDDYDSEDDDE